MTNNNYTNGWAEHKLLVLASLKSLEKKIDKINDQLIDISTQVTILKIKASLYGGVVGLVISILLNFLIFKLKK